LDNDFPFVCFSPKALAGFEGQAPHSEDIEEFAKNLDESSLISFYEGRYKWFPYPILSRGFNSFPVHGDLTTRLQGKKLNDAIGWAATIASNEEGDRFISALGLLCFLCREEKIPKEVPLLTKHFMAIRERISRNADNTDDPNISYWFSKVALFQLNTGIIPEGFSGSFDRAGLNAPGKKVIDRKIP